MKAFSTNKEVACLLKELHAEGWRFVRGKKHCKALHPNGAMVTFSVSPSDGDRVVRNIRRDIRRALGGQHGTGQVS